MARSKKKNLKHIKALKDLELLANQVGIKISYGDMRFAGLKLKSGQCEFKGEQWLVLGTNDSFASKVELFKEALSGTDLTGIEVSEDISKLIGKSLPILSSSKEKQEQ